MHVFIGRVFQKRSFAHQLSPIAMVVLKCGGLSRREKLLVTCTLPLEPRLRTRVWSFLSASSSWWPTCVVSEDDVEVEDGDRVLFRGRQYVDKELMNIGLVSKRGSLWLPERCICVSEASGAAGQWLQLLDIL